jgi:hypothetical protein
VDNSGAVFFGAQVEIVASHNIHAGFVGPDDRCGLNKRAARHAA